MLTAQAIIVYKHTYINEFPQLYIQVNFISQFKNKCPYVLQNTTLTVRKLCSASVLSEDLALLSRSSVP